MSKKEAIEEKTWSLLTPLCGEMGLIPVDAEYVKERGEYSLLIYVDKDGGVTIDDCEALSRALDPQLDAADFIRDPYTMIVSSPGLGRVIRRPRDFVFAKGKEVDVKLYQPMNGSKEFTAILADHDDDTVTFEGDDGALTLERKKIAKISLSFEL